MTEMQEKMMKKLGLSLEDFEPKATQEERLTTLEVTTDDLVLMMADLIGGENKYEDIKHIEIKNHGKSISHQN